MLQREDQARREREAQWREVQWREAQWREAQWREEQWREEQPREAQWRQAQTNFSGGAKFTFKTREGYFDAQDTCARILRSVDRSAEAHNIAGRPLPITQHTCDVLLNTTDSSNNEFLLKHHIHEVE